MSRGPTDPAGFDQPGLELVQDDERFFAAVCGLGTLGLLYRVMLGTLTADEVLAGDAHYELFVDPYPEAGSEHRVLVAGMVDDD